MFPQTSADEVHSAQNLGVKLQPLIQNLKDGALHKNTLAAEKVLRQEGQYFLSDDDILYRQSNTGKKTVIQIVVPTALQMELLQWCHDHFTSGYLGLNKLFEHLKSTYFWNNMQYFCKFTVLGKILCFLCSEEKRCPLFKTTYTHCCLWPLGNFREDSMAP